MVGKTLKQMAEELGVSKQRLYRFMKRENISESYQEGNTMYYDEAVEELIKSVFLSGETFHETFHETNQIHISDTSETLQKMAESYHEANETFRDTIVETLKYNEKTIESLQNVISMLQQELKDRDKQIEQLHQEHKQQIEQLQLALEEERLHNHEVSDKLAQLADQAQRLQLMQMQPPTLPAPDEEDQKQSFWKRIFKRG